MSMSDLCSEIDSFREEEKNNLIVGFPKYPSFENILGYSNWSAKGHGYNNTSNQCVPGRGRG